MRSFDPTFEPNGVVGVRRLEVITGVGGRRSWSREDKGRIVAESFAAWRQRIGIGAALRAAAATGLCLAPACPQRGAGTAGRRGGRVCSGHRRGRRDGTIDTGAVAGGHRRDRGCRHHDPRRAGSGLAVSARSAAGGEGGDVIPVPPGVRVLIATRPVDFRKGADQPGCACQGNAGAGPVLRRRPGVPQPPRRSRQAPGMGRQRLGVGVEAARTGCLQMAADHRRGDAPVAGTARRLDRGARLVAGARAADHPAEGDTLSTATLSTATN